LHLSSGVRAENFKLSSQRTDRLYKMISDRSWRQAPIALQMACVDAFFRHELEIVPFCLGSPPGKPISATHGEWCAFHQGRSLGVEVELIV
jgi:hypothetical protein